MNEKQEELIQNRLSITEKFNLNESNLGNLD